MTRRIIKNFTIEEVSAVADPAQTHGLAIIRKSADPQEIDEEQETDMDEMHSKIFARAAELGKTHKGMSYKQRCSIARQELPDIAKAENRIVTIARDDAVQRVAKSASVMTFEKRVVEVRSRDQCSNSMAMETARLEYPEEFAAYQSG